MPVVVKTATGQTLSFDVPLTSTVESLKSLVESSQGVPVAQQALFFQSTILDNTRALSEYGIADGAELQLTVSAGATAGGMSAGGASGAPQVSASLWVGDLDKAVTWQTLYEVFNPVAPVASIRVCRHHITHESLGYAYVNFHTAADADRVLNTMNYTHIAGRPCRVMWSERDSSSRRSGKGNIFIKNLNPETIDVQVLHDTFSKFGNVQSCKVAMDANGKHKGYGFVAFATDAEAQAAIDAVNGKRLDGYQVSVRKYVPRDQRQRTAEWNNVFVKDFPLTWTEENIQEEFGAVGPIQSVYMPKDSEGKRLGTAFVCFMEHAAAKEAVDRLNGKPMTLTKEVTVTAEDGTETTSTVTVEKPLYVARAQKKEERKRELEAARAAQRAERNASLLNRNLYVRNLDESVTEDALKAAFEPHGPIESVRIPKDDKGRSKLFGYVCYVNQADAAEAEAAMNGHTLAGKPLAVLPWLPRAQRKQAQAAQQQQPGWQRRQEPSAFGQGGRFGGAPNPYMAAMQRGGAGGMTPQQMMYMQQMQAMMAAASGGRGGQMNPQFMMQMMQMQMQMQRMMAAGAAQAHGMAPGQPVAQPQAGAPMASGPPVAGGAPPTEQRSLAEVLAASTPEQRRQLIGTTLFQAVSAIQPDQQMARKITGMLLESTQGDTAELLNLIESPADLRENVQGAMAALQGAAQ